MQIQSDNLAGGLVLTAIVLAILWLVIESAARVALNSAAGRRPSFRAALAGDEAGAVLAVDNTGPTPAYDVEVRWRDTPAAQPLLSTPLLGQGATWRADVPPGPGLTGRAAGAAPTLGWLTVRYRHEAPPTGAVLTASVPVLVTGPARPANEGRGA